LSAVIGAAAILTIILLRRSFKSLNKLTSQLYYSNEDLVSKEKQLETAKLSLERKNEELDDLNKRLQEREKAQRDFINVAAHELRTPIVPILNLSELLYSKFKKYGEEGGWKKTILEEGNRKIEEMVQVIVRNAYRLFHLTEDILDVTKIETQDLKLRPEELSIGKLLGSVVEDFRNNNSERKNVKITFRNQADSMAVRLDRGRIVQVVTNLLNNALKFTPEGLIQVTLGYQKDKGNGDPDGVGGGDIEAENKKEVKNENRVRNTAVVVSVEDSGLGIDPEIYPKLFSKFATKSEEGTGLGLYISKKIVEGHGGKIWAENNKNGKGSTFYFTLPLHNGEESKR
jgi:signal transduction histidine kinase